MVEVTRPGTTHALDGSCASNVHDVPDIHALLLAPFLEPRHVGEPPQQTGASRIEPRLAQQPNPSPFGSIANNLLSWTLSGAPQMQTPSQVGHLHLSHAAQTATENNPSLLTNLGSLLPPGTTQRLSNATSRLETLTNRAVGAAGQLLDGTLPTLQSLWNLLPSNRPTEVVTPRQQPANDAPGTVTINVNTLANGHALRQVDHLETVRITPQTAGGDLVQLHFDARQPGLGLSMEPDVALNVVRRGATVEVNGISGVSVLGSPIDSIHLVGERGAANRRVTVFFQAQPGQPRREMVLTNQSHIQRLDQLLDTLGTVTPPRAQ